MPEEQTDDLDHYFRDLALSLAVVCVRNTVIEDYHTHGKLTGTEMKAMNIDVADRLYTALQIMYNPAYAKHRDTFLAFLAYNYPYSWKKPELFDGFLTK